MCHFTWKRGLKFADGIKVASQLTLKLEDYPAYLGGLNGTTRALNREDGGQRVSVTAV